jgi:hypothetical protein
VAALRRVRAAQHGPAFSVVGLRLQALGELGDHGFDLRAVGRVPGGVVVLAHIRRGDRSGLTATARNKVALPLQPPVEEAFFLDP